MRGSPEPDESRSGGHGQAEERHLRQEERHERARDAAGGLAAPVADGVDDAGDEEDQAEDGGRNRVAEAAGEQVDQEERQLLQSVLLSGRETK